MCFSLYDRMLPNADGCSTIVDDIIDMYVILIERSQAKLTLTVRAKSKRLNPTILAKTSFFPGHAN